MSKGRAALLSLIALGLLAWRFDRWMQEHYGDCVYIEDDDDGS